VIDLRHYQRFAVQAIEEALQQYKRTLAVMPTGTGKTIVFAEVIRHVVESGGKALVVAHRDELLSQASDKIEFVIPGVQIGIEKAEQKVNRDDLPAVTVASVQSIGQDRRLESFAPNSFRLVVVDEAHHACAARYLRILDHFSTAKILGVTATPDRFDKLGLHNVFDSVAHVYEIRDAIEDKWLVPIVQKRVAVKDLDLSSVRTVAGDFNQGELEKELLRERVLHETASPLAELAGNRPTIVFTAGVEQAYALAKVLEGYVGSGRVEALDGAVNRDTRTDVLSSFQQGHTQYLVNCALFTEGFDAPLVSCIAVARPTQSRALYAQMVGRGTRLHPESGKENLLVLDFAGNAGRHRLVSALDVLDGRPIDDEVREVAEDLADEYPELAVHELLDEAVQEVITRKRKAAIRVQAKARYDAHDIDPFALFGADSRPGRWGGVAATEKQLSFLTKNGFGFASDSIDRGQASALIGKIIARRERGLCTAKQARLLLRYGLSTDLPFETAHRVIDAIAANRWRVPSHINEVIYDATA
jgi:superfamily II DNA or RNA helicase